MLLLRLLDQRLTFPDMNVINQEVRWTFPPHVEQGFAGQATSLTDGIRSITSLELPLLRPDATSQDYSYQAGLTRVCFFAVS